MSLILSHIGELLPAHFFDCINQTTKYYNNKIVLITNAKNTDILSKYNIKIFEPDFENPKFKIAEKINFYEYPSKEFWLYSLSRFFFIEDYVAKNKVDNFVIYENDVLIYSDLSEMINKLSTVYKNISITIGDETRATTGFSFFKSYKDLIQMNEDIITISQDENEMTDIYKNYASCCPSEMVFIRKIAKEKKYIEPLPLFPDDNYYNQLNFVFDPAAYGQFLGGTSKENGGYGKEYIDNSTYIGKKILNGEYNVNFSKENGPILTNIENKKTNIYNLHIHSKKLYEFTNY